MQTLKNIGGVAGRGAEGYALGASHGSSIVGGAASLNTRLQGFGQYRRNQEAAQLSRTLSARLPRRAPGPRTAAAYAYDYGIGGGLGAAAAGSGTEEQRALLAHVRRNQERVEAVRNNQPPRGAHHNVDPTVPSAPPPANPMANILNQDQRIPTGNPAEARRTIMGAAARARQQGPLPPPSTRPPEAGRPMRWGQGEPADFDAGSMGPRAPPRAKAKAKSKSRARAYMVD
jgi:hypothetical protein